MFTNLIESSADKLAFKRRSSFFLATVAGYALFLFAAGIVGVLTYDAQVAAQTTNLQVEAWIPPVNREPDEPKALPPRAANNRFRSNAPVDQNITTPERVQQIPPIDDLRVTPQEIGLTGSSSPPVEGPVRLTGRDADPPKSSAEATGCPGCSGAPATAVISQPPTEPTPVKPLLPQRVSSTVLAAKVISLPKPGYPPIAKQIRAQGPVNVQIVVDENGRVISARAVSGNMALVRAAEEAAMRARFTPTLLNKEPVKVQGVITYNFVLQ